MQSHESWCVLALDAPRPPYQIPFQRGYHLDSSAPLPPNPIHPLLVTVIFLTCVVRFDLLRARRRFFFFFIIASIIFESSSCDSNPPPDTDIWPFGGGLMSLIST